MSSHQKTILSSSIRIFFIALFAMLGVGTAFFLLLLFSALTSTSSIEYANTATILPNAEGKREELASTVPVVLQIDIQGIIGTELLNMEKIRTLLMESREGDLKNNRVKAVLLHLNSPGGTVTDADGIYQALKEYKAHYQVPIYAYVDGLCASGGMYIAAAADKVYASDVSLIGSVGVLMPTFMNFSQLLEKIGVKTTTLAAGKGKDDMNPLRPWKEGEEESYRAIVDYYYQHFVDLLANNRPQIDREKLIQEYGAHVFPAKKAQELGYIDGVEQEYKTVLKSLVQAAGLDGKKYQVMKLESKSWIASLFKGEHSICSGKIKHHVQILPGFEPELIGKFLYLYRP